MEPTCCCLCDAGMIQSGVSWRYVAVDLPLNTSGPRHNKTLPDSIKGEAAPSKQAVCDTLYYDTFSFKRQDGTQTVQSVTTLFSWPSTL